MPNTALQNLREFIGDLAISTATREHLSHLAGDTYQQAYQRGHADGTSNEKARAENARSREVTPRAQD